MKLMRRLLLSMLLCLSLQFALPPRAIAQQERPSRQLKLEEAKEQSERRVALVIGNGGYENAPRLKNPPNDATDIADALSKLGFTVEHGVDLTQKQMKFIIREFGKKLKSGGQGLFFFAGHGVQLRGRNYLIPIDADIQSEADVEDQGVDASLILGLMDEAGNGLNMVILDACRNNPFARSFRSSANGLAPVDAPTGTLIAYATAPGRVARDGTGHNGAYTAELLKQMRVPGLPIEELLKRVRANVKTQTNGEQVPWESSSLVGDFYLNKATSAANKTTGGMTSTPVVDPAAFELEYWNAIKDSSDPEEYRGYLERYPNGQFTEIARRRAAGKRGGNNTGAGTPPGNTVTIPAPNTTNVPGTSSAKKTASSDAARPTTVSAAYIGQYEVAKDFILTITNEDGKLMGQPTGDVKAEFKAEGTLDRFFSSTVDAHLKFARNDKDEVIGVVITINGKDFWAKKVK
jgi:hypothetical protein